MNKRGLRLIVLAVVGVVILVIGIGAATIYTQRFSREMKDIQSQFQYHRNYDELSRDEKAKIDRILLNFDYKPLSIEEKNAQFRERLVKPLKWIGIGFGIFVILTSALVASRLILNRTKSPPPSS